MKCDAVWVAEPNKIEVRPVEIADEPGFGQIQVEVKACGVCAWDSYLFQGVTGPGPTPYPIGHESIGIIRKIGEGVTGFEVGDNVFLGAGSNEMMSQYLNIIAAGAAKLPETIDDWSKWIIEPTCCVVNLLNKTQIEEGDTVALVGCGYMGLLTLMGLLRGSQAGKVIVFEKKPERRALARQYGAGLVYDPYDEEGQEAIRELKAKGGADVVIEFSASNSGFELANELIRYEAGKLTIGSWHRHEMTFDATKWHLGGLTVYNLSPMSNRHYTDVMKQTKAMVDKGVYTPQDLVTHVADFRDCQTIFEKSVSKEDGYMKGVITF